VTVDIPDDLPAVDADPGPLQRVLVNVIGNALRFSPPGRPSLVAATGYDSRIEVRIVDSGPGIPAEHRDRVFLRSSGWATGRTTAASGSAWPCPAA
jgi:two-component system sensor histidine kinase KdpD